MRVMKKKRTNIQYSKKRKTQTQILFLSQPKKKMKNKTLNKDDNKYVYTWEKKTGWCVIIKKRKEKYKRKDEE